jgi:hypothetical protein
VLGAKESAMNKMRKASGLVLVALAAAISIAVAAAMAQDLPKTDVSVKVKTTSSNAGSEKNPQGIAISAVGKLTTEPGFDPPVVTGVDILVGQGLSWNGGDYVKCSKRVLDREGPEGCPRESIMGSATATAKADTVDTQLDIVLVNAGSKRLFAYTTLTNPARVRETIVIKTTNMTGKWRYRDSFRVPKSLQVVAGIPIQVTGFKLKLGGKPYARSYITTTSCPNGAWNYQATAHYLYDLTGQTATDTVSGSIPCTK